MKMSEAMKLTGYSWQTIANKIKDGSLKATKDGRLWDIDEESLEAYVGDNGARFSRRYGYTTDAVINFPESLKEYVFTEMKSRFLNRSAMSRVILAKCNLDVSAKTIEQDFTKLMARRSRIKIYEEFFKEYGYNTDEQYEPTEEPVAKIEAVKVIEVEKPFDISKMTEEDIYHMLCDMNSRQLLYTTLLITNDIFRRQEDKRYGREAK